MNDKLSVPRRTHFLINHCCAQIKIHRELGEMALKRLDEREVKKHQAVIDQIIITMLKGISFNAGQTLKRAKW